MLMPRSDVYVNTTFLCLSTGNMYRRGARRWRKLYVYNGHSYQAKRFSRVRIACLSVCIYARNFSLCFSVSLNSQKLDTVVNSLGKATRVSHGKNSHWDKVLKNKTTFYSIALFFYRFLFQGRKTSGIVVSYYYYLLLNAQPTANCCQ